MMELSISMYEDVTLFENCRHIPLVQCSNEWHRRFYGTDVEPVMALDQSALGTVMNKLPNPHFAARIAGARESVAYC